MIGRGLSLKALIAASLMAWRPRYDMARDSGRSPGRPSLKHDNRLHKVRVGLGHHPHDGGPTGTAIRNRKKLLAGVPVGVNGRAYWDRA